MKMDMHSIKPLAGTEPKKGRKMDTEFLVQQYLANGGTITKLPDGKAEGALDLGRKDAIGERDQSLVIYDEEYEYFGG